MTASIGPCAGRERRVERRRAPGGAHWQHARRLAPRDRARAALPRGSRATAGVHPHHAHEFRCRVSIRWPSCCPSRWSPPRANAGSTTSATSRRMPTSERVFAQQLELAAERQAGIPAPARRARRFHADPARVPSAAGRRRRALLHRRRRGARRLPRSRAATSASRAGSATSGAGSSCSELVRRHSARSPAASRPMRRTCCRATSSRSRARAATSPSTFHTSSRRLRATAANRLRRLRKRPRKMRARCSAGRPTASETSVDCKLNINM